MNFDAIKKLGRDWLAISVTVLVACVGAGFAVNSCGQVSQQYRADREAAADGGYGLHDRASPILLGGIDNPAGYAYESSLCGPRGKCALLSPLVDGGLTADWIDAGRIYQAGNLALDTRTTGACGANSYVTTINANAAPTCNTVNVGYFLYYDCDYTALPRSAEDGGDGTVYTLCGAPCTVIGSGVGTAHLLGYTELDGGLWAIQLDAGGANTSAVWSSTASTSNLTGLSCDLSSILPSTFNYATPIAIEVFLLREIVLSPSYSNAFDQIAVNFALAPESGAGTVWPDITFETLANSNQFWGAVPSMSSSSIQMDSPSGQGLGYAWWDSVRVTAPNGMLGYMVEVAEGKYDGGTLFADRTQWQHTEGIFNTASTASQFQPWGATNDQVAKARLRIGVLRDVAAGGTASVPYIFGRVRFWAAVGM